MKKGRIFFIILTVVLAGFLAFSSPAWAKKKARPRSKTPSKYFVLDISVGISYDDNILRYSDTDLGIFGNDSLPTKFAIESKNDWIINPQIRPRLQGRIIDDLPASVTLGYDYFGYVKNDVRRYSRFLIEARQYFSPKGYAQLTYSYVPKYYYRNLFFGTDSAHIDQFLPASFSKNAVSAQVGYDITRSIRASVGYDYQRKSFNREFNYRDLNLHGFGADATWRIQKPLKLWAIFNYEFARARGADMDNSIPDFSYNAWDITFGARHYTSILPKYKPEVFTSFQFRRIDYISGKLPDILGRNIYQFGRSDNNCQLRLGTAWQIPYRIRLEADYAFTVKRASLPEMYPNPILNITQTTDELEKKLNYSANTVSLRLSRQF